MDIASRLVEFKNYCGLTNSEFCDMTNIPRPTLSQFLSGRNKRLSDNLAARIHEGFPNLNMMWLLFGEGDMLIDQSLEMISKNPLKENDGNTKDERQHEHSTDGQQSLFDQDMEPVSAEKKEVFKEKKEVSVDAPYATVVRASTSKMVNHIMVFYTDGSWDEFRPIKRENI